MKECLLLLQLFLLQNVYGQVSYVVGKKDTLSLIKGPVTFMMGSPASEPLRDSTEVLHTATIPRSYAIATKEVTVAQFQQFLDENPSIKDSGRAALAKSPLRDNQNLLLFSPFENCPQIYVTWYEAAQYCNWLSKKEGIPEDEWCYPSGEQLKSGMQLPADYLHRTGYRLPTEAEWEFACRAGTATSHFFDQSVDSLDAYAIYTKHPPKLRTDKPDPNDPKHASPVGSLKPNPLGLFDMYGNVWEWCGSRRIPYKSPVAVDDEDDVLLVTDSVAMIRRGGSYSYGKETTRSAHRGSTTYFPNQRRDSVGFRVARTIRR